MRKMQIKTTLRQCFTPIRMAKINQINDSSRWWGCEGAEHMHCWWEKKTSTATMKIRVVISLETRNRSKSRSRYTTFSHAQSTSYPTTKETTDQSCSLLL